MFDPINPLYYNDYFHDANILILISILLKIGMDFYTNQYFDYNHCHVEDIFNGIVGFWKQGKHQ